MIVLAPMTEGLFVGWFCCAGCGDVFRKRDSLEWHLEHTACGPMLIEEMLVEQEYELIQRGRASVGEQE